MRQIFRHVVLLFVTLCLTSCGFHLRGTTPLNPQLKNLYLKTADPYGQLARNLQAYFKMSGVHLTSTATAANYIFEVIHETKTRDLINVSGTQQTSQYNLVLSVTFQLTKPDGTVILVPQTINKSRVFTMQTNQILGGSNEEASMYEQMEQDIVYDIMSRISSIEVTHILQDQKKHS